MAAISQKETTNETEVARSPKSPPPWFVHGAWRVHRGLYKMSRGRFLWTTSNKRGWGALHLTTIGRRTGQERSVIVGYLEDGPNLVLVAMNGWDEGHPAWWLNLRAHPDATVRLPGEEQRPVRARRTEGEERERLWQRWAAVQQDYDRFARHRSTDTPVIILEPAPSSTRSHPHLFLELIQGEPQASEAAQESGDERQRGQGA